jgi:hypothetical protein
MCQLDVPLVDDKAVDALATALLVAKTIDGKAADALDSGLRGEDC